MTAQPATALRLGLHLLLAACLLLQGTVAAALATTMAGAGRVASTVPPAAATLASRMDAAALPPCHMAATAAVEQDAPAQGIDAHDCCNAMGGLCDWACANAPPLAMTRVAPPVQGLPETPDATVLPAAPHWPVKTPLRPPIA